MRNFQFWGEKSDKLAKVLFPAGTFDVHRSFMLYQLKEPDLKKTVEAKDWKDASEQFQSFNNSTIFIGTLA